MLMPWRFAQPLAAVREVVAGSNTLYLCSPRGEQRHYEPLFRGALRMVLEEQQRRVDQGNGRRLLLVLDEAATVASLDELDQLAATVSGLGVTLVTVIQDFAQLVARWGPRAATIVNNHTTRVVLGGLGRRHRRHLSARVGGKPTRGAERAPFAVDRAVRGWWSPRVGRSFTCDFAPGGAIAASVTGAFVRGNYDFSMAYQSLLLQEQIFAIDIGATNIKFSHVNDMGVLVRGVRRRPTPYPCSPDRLVEFLEERIVKSGCRRVGVGFPGEFRDGHVIAPGNLSRPGRNRDRKGS